MSENEKGLSVAVIGMGCIFPKSVGVHEYWRLLYHGENAITDVPSSHWSRDDYFDSDPNRPDHTYCTKGGYIPAVDFDPTEFGIPPANLEATDSSQLLGLLAAKMALDDAGYGKDGKPFNRDRTSVILGVTGTQELVIPLGARLGFPKWRRALESAGVAPEMAEQVMAQISGSYVEWKENSFPGLLGNVVAGRICNRLDLNGTNCVVDAACASSMSALHLALLELGSGRSDMVLTGGVDSLNDIFMHMCFAKTHILSPTGEARPFSENADGTVLGEGIGIVLLKRLADAEKDGDRIYAVIRGIGTSSDGKSQSIYAPRAEGQARALKMAYDSAGVDPLTVGLVEAHGTGTRVGDMVEFSALKQVFGSAPDDTPFCAIGSVKSMIGHTKAAAGSAGLIKTILSLYHKVLPPTLKINRPDPKLEIENSPFYLNTQSRPWFTSHGSPRRAGVSAFGFGGSNFHTVLEEYHPEKPEPAWDGSVQIVALSADSPAALAENLFQLQSRIKAASSRQDIARIAADTRSQFSTRAAHRLVFVLDRETMVNGSWSERIDEVVQVWQSGIQHTPADGHLKKVYYGGPGRPGALAFVFPGQGSQYVGMVRDLVSVFPQAFQVMQDAAALEPGATSLMNILYPAPMLPAEQKEALSKTLQGTDIAQPAIGAASLAMLETLRHFGIAPDSVCGHSFGELTALFAAGWLDRQQLLNLARERGRCMAAAGGGSMLAVRAGLKQLEDVLADNRLDLVLANRNSPDQGVLSGSTAEIRRAEQLLKEKGLRCVRLPVSAAFHSELMQSAQKPFARVLHKTPLTPAKTPVYANTSAAPYPVDADQAVGLLRDQLLQPVDFVGCIENMYAAGVRTFVEVGPKKVLTGLIGSILKGRDFAAVALDASAGARFGVSDLADVLCRLAGAGFPVALERWEIPAASLRQPKMRIPICGANYRDPRRSLQPPPPKPKTAAVDHLAAQLSAAAPAAAKPKPSPEPPATRPPVDDNPITGKRPMKNNAPAAGNPHRLAGALAAVQEGLRSMQQLQQQTAAAHTKFLDTQAEAGRTLQSMLESLQRMSSASDGLTPARVPPPQAARPVTDRQPPSAPPADVREPAVEQEAVVAMPAEAISAPEQPRPAIPASDNKDNDGVNSALLQVVSDLTGYPTEMIGLDMDIESDLGIDSIKRVEILSALEAKLPDLPAVSPETMATMKTLGQIIAHLGPVIDTVSHPAPDTPSLPAAENPVQEQSANAAAPGASGELTGAMLEVVSELTGYPVDMIGLDMDIESDLGIDSIKRVEILSALEQRVPDMPAVAPEVMGTLKTLGQIAELLHGPASSMAPDAVDPAAGTSTGVLAQTAAKDPATVDTQDITGVLLEVVGELTGYPVDMIGLDMDIESDLGIDSIKRVEILSALESRVPQLPAVPPEVMGGLKTLGHVADYLSNASSSPTPAEPAATQPPATAAAQDRPSKRPVEPAPVARRIVTPVARQRATGGTVVLPAARKVFITEDHTGLARSLADLLAHRNIHSVILSTDILKYKSQLPEAAGLIVIENPESPHPADDLQQAFMLARHLAPSLLASAAQGGAFFATLTRLDGAFGFQGRGVQRPLSGGLAGLAKTAAIEWEGVNCKAIDLHPDWKDLPAIAEAVVAELLHTRGQEGVEIGLAPGGRCELHLATADFDDQRSYGIQLSKNDVVVISGGARGVTAAAAHALAEKTGAAMVLLGRSPEPSPAPDWIEMLSDEADMKKAILANEFGGTAPTPKQLESSYRRHMANREMLRNLERIRGTGSRAAYFSVDIRDADKVKTVLENVRRTLGPVAGVIHGAGVLEDRRIVDKTPEQFEKVFSTKVEGFEALLQATAEDRLRYLVLFSSVAARFGNKGQVDYAMANEALNKYAQQQAAERVDCRVVSINWGPWDGGMVTPGVKREFERQGIDLIPLEAGARAMLEELAIDTGGPAEVVLGGSLLPEQGQPETGPPGAQPEAVVQNSPDLALAFKRHVDVQRFPVLGDHVLDGKPVVPLALMSEWFGHSALHGNPGLHLQGLDDVRVLQGIKIDQGQKLVRLFAGKARRSGQSYEVDLEIRDGMAAGVDVVHSRARAVLVDQLGQPPAFDTARLENLRPYKRPIEEVYDKILFHGAALRGIRSIRHLDKQSMVADIAPAPAPADWMKEPMRKRWLADPLVLDSAFQMAIVWSYEQTGNPSLPVYFSAYRQYRPAFPKEAVTVVMEVKSSDKKKMTCDFTFLDKDRKVIARLSGYEAFMDPGLHRAFRQQDSAADQRL